MEDLRARLGRIEERTKALESRADQSDLHRDEIESRLLNKLTSIESTIEKMGHDQVEAIKALQASLASQSKRNELQDQDLERIKEVVHKYMRDKTAPVSVAASGVATIIMLIAQHFVN